MKDNKVHPADLGFRRGLGASVSDTGIMAEEFVADDARIAKDVVYIAIRDDKQIIKVGQTGGSFLGRWRGALRVIGEGKPLSRETERLARTAWQNAVRGRRFEVWFKPASKAKLELVPGEVMLVSQRLAEEIYFDGYYHPLIGRKLEGRAFWAVPEREDSPP